ncbi:MAG: methyltransferase [Proteobacteria bacterium]|nr:methyltransferase [Pseudomonadota bacterium]
MPANISPPPEPGLTRDTLLDGRVVLWQPAEGYRAAIDPVLLAAAVEAGAGAKVLDLGCGAGTIALCLLARCPKISVTGLEIDDALAALARRNAAENGVSENFQTYQGSVAALAGGSLAGEIEAFKIEAGSFDIVVSNPPYLEAGRASLSPDLGKRTADVESTADLETWIGAASRALKPKGALALIHRADRLDHILALLRGRFGGITIHPLWPKQGVPAKRVIIQARKGMAAPTRLEPGTVLHQTDGPYTDAARIALSGGALKVD